MWILYIVSKQKRKTVIMVTHGVIQPLVGQFLEIIYVNVPWLHLGLGKPPVGYKDIIDEKHAMFLF